MKGLFRLEHDLVEKTFIEIDVENPFCTNITDISKCWQETIVIFFLTKSICRKHGFFVPTDPQLVKYEMI